MGAHAPRLARKTTPILLLALSLAVVAFGATDSAALFKFKEALQNNSALDNWNSSVNPCDWNRPNWVGILCLNGTIWGLKLEGMGLTGIIDIDSLVPLSHFRTLSLMNNQFVGPFPHINKLGKLKALYLSNNRFSGQIPDDAFQGMGSLKRVFLANNEFSGNIPLSLSTLPRLMELRLEGNQFQGRIPDFRQKNLKTVNLASNFLVGPIPEALSKMNPDSFSGNKDLCGPPLYSCNSPLRALNKKVALAMFHRKRHRPELERNPSLSMNSNKIAPSYVADQQQCQVPAESSAQSRRSDKLSFVRDDIEKFDLNELLRASAEVLGSGTFGSSYKAAVGSGQALVVKRYRHMNNVGREEFHEHMRRLGRLKHPNLLRLTAYYYRREEKLLVYEFVENGSLASHIHGNRSLEGQGLDWQTRLRIIKGVAKGLAYLYSELPILVPHGHLKSSNVLLDPSMEPLLTDYTLRPVINPQQAHNLMIAYKSPEYAQNGRTSKKTDIWSFGILILEILTGKFPENYLTQGYDSSADIASWVNKMVKEKRTSEVFDKDMKGAKDSKGEMINLLKIGLSCCEEDVESRLDIKEVVEKIEQLREGDSDEDYTGNEGINFSVRGNEDRFSYTVDR
ncbi:pollen receptor-like kinase 4 isoform X2 [Hevea brasiliensis]|uniref:pollen receptor-like kinase 4 isoform X2 n=1 Tax=Hevea brasiliensis TaxID=3981 RepID=UPI0025FD1B77|nr:pollen receptor-like kinase 4 isoform X2 [Hevea brasiliensis]